MKLWLWIFACLSLGLSPALASTISVGGPANYQILTEYQQVGICWGHRQSCTYLDLPDVNGERSCPAAEIRHLLDFYPSERHPHSGHTGTVVNLMDYLHRYGRNGEIYAEILDCPGVRHDAYTHNGLICVTKTGLAPNTPISFRRFDECDRITGLPGD